MDSIWFNDDDNYKNAMTSALDMKRGTLRKFQELHSERMRVVGARARCVSRVLSAASVSVWKGKSSSAASVASLSSVATSPASVPSHSRLSTDTPETCAEAWVG